MSAQPEKAGEPVKPGADGESEAERPSRRALDVQLRALKRSFFANADLSDEQVHGAMGAAIDDALHDPPRRSYPAGSVLLRQGEPVESISILLEGQVQLSRRIEDREIVIHRQTAGPIIGLLSLAHRQRSFFTCRAISDVTILPLSLEQLDTALQSDPWLSGYFVTALVRSMATRSKRTAQLKAEIENLSDKLRAERDQLADALHRLQQAQTRLVESEKLATLGQLTAGIAHELNNPVAAIRRSADFIAEDVVALVGELPKGESIKATLETALTSTPLSTRELRRRRAALTAEAKDEALARRLLKLGISTPAGYREAFGASSGVELEGLLRQRERYHELGTSLRNLGACSDRISGIVQGLRSYARSGEDVVNHVDMHEGIESTLRLMQHALRNVRIERSFGEIPLIECRPGELNQVWTNLISNALHAMGDSGTLRVETDAPDAGNVRVRISDTGKGIAPDMLDRIFDPQFTTKDGRVEFGLGMGLPICRLIVAKHGGTIAAESTPGATCFTVALPVNHPRSQRTEADS